MGKPNPKIIEIVKKFKENVKKKYDVQNIILFGSQATGKAKKGSDIDLIVISKRLGKNAFKGTICLAEEWHEKLDIPYPVDFLCYTPKEFEKLKRKITIVRQAIAEGIVI